MNGCSVHHREKRPSALELSPELAGTSLEFTEHCSLILLVSILS